MTITRTPTGQWELHTREGQLVGRGDLNTIISLWVRMLRDGWSPIPFGQPATAPLSGRRTVECTATEHCPCRACRRITDPTR